LETVLLLLLRMSAVSYIRGVEISVKATRRGDQTPSLFLRFSCFSFCNKNGRPLVERSFHSNLFKFIALN
jgi:hypothetical protein